MSNAAPTPELPDWKKRIASRMAVKIRREPAFLDFVREHVRRRDRQIEEWRGELAEDRQKVTPWFEKWKAAADAREEEHLKVKRNSPPIGPERPKIREKEDEHARGACFRLTDGISAMVFALSLVHDHLARGTQVRVNPWQEALNDPQRKPGDPERAAGLRWQRLRCDWVRDLEDGNREDFEEALLDVFAEFDRTQAASGEAPPQAGGSAANGDFVHSDDYRSVLCGGQEFTFSTSQSIVVKELHQQIAKGITEVSTSLLLAKAEARRMIDVFRNSPAWMTLIIHGSKKGFYRLAIPPHPPPSKNLRAKKKRKAKTKSA